MAALPAPDPALRAALRGVRGLLLDLDGVLVLKGKAVPGAVDAMNELERRRFPYLVVTNTSLVSRGRLAGWGRKVGFTTPPDRFQSALSASVDFVRREYGDKPVFVIASPDARTELTGLNVVTGSDVDADPAAAAAVILGDSPDELTKENLDRAFRCMKAGAQLVGMHRNGWWLTSAGPTLDAGAFLVGLEWAAGRRAHIVGKPSPSFFATAIRRLVVEAEARGEPPLRRSQLAMIGDDVNSDIGGGRRAGMRTVFVRSGKHGDAELEATAGRKRFPYAPDAVAPSIAEVVAALP